MTNYAYLEKTRAQGEAYKGLFERGLSIREIAQQAGVNRSTVERWVYTVFKCAKRRPSTAWTEEMDNTLKEMWVQGRSAVDIGKAVGMTKNSVLGRKSRLKLENRQTGWNTGPRKPRAQAVRKKVKVAEVVEPTSGPIGFMELEDFHCREVLGHGSDSLALYCGNHRFNDLPYCKLHTRINYNWPSKYAPTPRG